VGCFLPDCGGTFAHCPLNDEGRHQHAPSRQYVTGDRRVVALAGDLIYFVYMQCLLRPHGMYQGSAAKGAKDVFCVFTPTPARLGEEPVEELRWKGHIKKNLSEGFWASGVLPPGPGVGPKGGCCFCSSTSSLCCYCLPGYA